MCVQCARVRVGSLALGCLPCLGAESLNGPLCVVGGLSALHFSGEGAEVGGQTPGVSGEEAEPRKDADMEPVAFHGDSATQVQEDMHTFKMRAAIELTVLDEVLCLEFLEQRKPWAGICFTQEHADRLRKRTIYMMWQKFSQESSDHYKPALASLLQKAGMLNPQSANLNDQKGKNTRTQAAKNKRRASNSSAKKNGTAKAEAGPKTKKAKKATCPHLATPGSLGASLGRMSMDHQMLYAWLLGSLLTCAFDLHSWGNGASFSTAFLLEPGQA